MWVFPWLFANDWKSFYILHVISSFSCMIIWVEFIVLLLLVKMLEFLFMGLGRQQCPHRLPQKFLLSCQNGCLSETTTSQDCRNVNKIGGDKPTISYLLYVSTGKSLSEALLFAEHEESMLHTEIVLHVKNNFCTQHVLPIFCKKKELLTKIYL